MARLLISCRRSVMSSWPRVRLPSLDVMLGRAIGGGTRMFCTIRSRGCEPPNPRSVASLSDIPLRIERASIAVNCTNARSRSSFDSNSTFAGHSVRMATDALIAYDGRGAAQCGHFFLCRVKV